VWLDGFNPLEQSGYLTAYEQKNSILLDQLSCAILVAACQGMTDGFGDKSVLFEPLRSAAVQVGNYTP